MRKLIITSMAFLLATGLTVSVDYNRNTPYLSTVDFSYIEEALARFSSSRSFSSRSVRVSSFKPSKSASKPLTTSAASKPKVTAPRVKTPMEKAASRTASRQAATAATARFKVPPRTNVSTGVASARSSTIGRRIDNVDRTTYYSRRDTAMSRYQKNSRVPQNVIVQSSPSFGFYDSWFMWYVVMGNPSFGYHHHNDPGYLEWKREAERLAATNADLRAQLDEHNRAVAGMSGPRDAAYLPEGVDGDVIFAPAMVEAAVPQIRWCTGRTDGKYFTAASTLDQLVAQSDIKTVATAGSVQNLQMIANGDCDAAFVQRDAYIVFADQNPEADLGLTRLGSLYDEDVHLFCSREREFYHLQDLQGSTDTQLYVGDLGSGAATTWANFVELNDTFAGITVVNKSATDPSFGKAPNHCGLYVGKTGAQYVSNLSTSGLRMIDIESVPTDGILDPEGKPVYSTHEIPSGTYGTQHGWNDSGMFTFTPTISVPVDIIVADRWKDANRASGAALTEISGLKGTVKSSL